MHTDTYLYTHEHVSYLAIARTHTRRCIRRIFERRLNWFHIIERNYRRVFNRIRISLSNHYQHWWQGFPSLAVVDNNSLLLLFGNSLAPHREKVCVCVCVYASRHTNKALSSKITEESTKCRDIQSTEKRLLNRSFARCRSLNPSRTSSANSDVKMSSRDDIILIKIKWCRRRTMWFTSYSRFYDRVAGFWHITRLRFARQSPIKSDSQSHWSIGRSIYLQYSDKQKPTRLLIYAEIDFFFLSTSRFALWICVDLFGRFVSSTLYERLSTRRRRFSPSAWCCCCCCYCWCCCSIRMSVINRRLRGCHCPSRKQHHYAVKLLTTETEKQTEAEERRLIKECLIVA